jgi:membrane-associated phospholipid phosphatase
VPKSMVHLPTPPPVPALSALLPLWVRASSSQQSARGRRSHSAVEAFRLCAFYNLHFRYCEAFRLWAFYNLHFRYCDYFMWRCFGRANFTTSFLNLFHYCKKASDSSTPSSHRTWNGSLWGSACLPSPCKNCFTWRWD